MHVAVNTSAYKRWSGRRKKLHRRHVLGTILICSSEDLRKKGNPCHRGMPPQGLAWVNHFIVLSCLGFVRLIHWCWKHVAHIDLWDVETLFLLLFSGTTKFWAGCCFVPLLVNICLNVSTMRYSGGTGLERIVSCSVCPAVPLAVDSW